MPSEWARQNAFVGVPPPPPAAAQRGQQRGPGPGPGPGPDRQPPRGRSSRQQRSDRSGVDGVLQAARLRKEEGNRLFGEGSYALAAGRYRAALEALGVTEGTVQRDGEPSPLCLWFRDRSAAWLMSTLVVACDRAARRGCGGDVGTDHAERRPVPAPHPGVPRRRARLHAGDLAVGRRERRRAGEGALPARHRANCAGQRQGRRRRRRVDQGAERCAPPDHTPGSHLCLRIADERARQAAWRTCERRHGWCRKTRLLRRLCRSARRGWLRR